MTEDFLERLRMANQDDDDDELVQLKQLRQVWLAMPDEEPPSRGLDALMAAARTKAEEMKPAPWWRRMFAVMVRPPVLALATVVVVAGGAVLVHNHRGELEKHEQVEGERAPTNDVIAGNAEQGSAAPAPPMAAPAEVELGKASGDTTAADPRIEAPGKADAKPTPKPVTVPAHHASPKKGESGGKGSTGGLFTPDDETVADKVILSQQPKAPPPPPPPPPKQARPVEKPADNAPPMTKAPRPTPESGMAAGALDTGTANTNRGAQPMAATLLAKARAAAERNDCATVKSLLEQIAKLDAAYYRTTAAKDATVGKCMQIAD